MRNESFSPLYILATCLASIQEADAAIHGFFGGTPRPVEGAYKGEVERSYIVTGTTKEQVQTFLKEFNQESALFLDNQRNGWLVFADSNEPVLLGEWKKTNEEHAKAQDGWTKIDGQYYICQ